MEKIIPTYIEDELRKSYLDYAMSVIVGRALPDVRDGLKPVHRRILFAMYKLALWHNKGFRKCATVVGEVLGKYHPHGDLAVYDALARLVQEFSLRYPLLQGKGNFGSIDGDSPAAYRYTETKLNEIAELMLKDIEKQTVEMKPNFDETLEEPSILPSQFPNLLVNGSSGIAVGMATNIPPHNLNEVVDALVALIDNPELDKFSKYILGPDFPTGGILTGYAGLDGAYSTGRGKITLKAKAEIEEINGREVILVTEIPYQVNKSALIAQMAELAKDKKIEGISDIRDESSKEGIRIVIELKHSAQSQIVLNRLFKHTQMQTTFGIIFLALQNGEPKLLPLKNILSAFLDHRFSIVKSRSEFELKETEKEAHILEGLKKALSNIEEVIKIIRKAKSSEEAQKELTAAFMFSKEQTTAILEMRLSRLVALEREKLDVEYKEKLAIIKKLKTILSSKANIMSVVKEELQEVKKKFGNPRKTKINFKDDTEFDIEDLIPDEPVFVTLTEKGYVKRSKSGIFPRQHRAGKGVAGIKLVLEDKVNKILFTKTHSDIIFFTNLGRCYKAKAYELPETERSAQGKSLANLFPFKPNERVEDIMPVESFGKQRIVIVTKKGVIKQMDLSNFENIRKSGIIAIALREGDKIAGTIIVEPKDYIIIVSRKGKVIRFKESLLRLTSRTSHGVRGIRIRGDDEVITLEHTQDMKLFLLFVTRNGFGKKVPVPAFRETNRGGVGIIGSKEELAGCNLVTDDMEVILTTQNGGTLRTDIKAIRRKGRPARGVTLIDLKEGDKVKDVEVLCSET